VAVDPDATLRAHAAERGWPIMSLRDEAAAPPAEDERARRSRKARESTTPSSE
jgi:hypothetical protein